MSNQDPATRLVVLDNVICLMKFWVLLALARKLALSRTTPFSCIYNKSPINLINPFGCIAFTVRGFESLSHSVISRSKNIIHSFINTYNFNEFPRIFRNEFIFCILLIFPIKIILENFPERIVKKLLFG